jgi:hypothetical protein
MPDFLGGVLATDDSLPLAAENESGNPGSPPPGEFDSPDLVIPTVTFTPVSGSNRDPDQSVQIDVVDPVSGDIGGLRRVVIMINYDDPTGFGELVYDGTVFTANFSGSATSSITDGTRYTVVRDDDGWLTDFEMHVFVFDTSSNEPASQPSSADYLVPDGVGLVVEPPPNAVRPVVTFVSPAPGTPITPDSAITLTATDDVAELVNVSIDVTFPDGVSEMIFDGDSFTPLYRAGSTRATIANGFQFTVRRARGGWPATPTFNAEAVDRDGNRSI